MDFLVTAVVPTRDEGLNVVDTVERLLRNSPPWMDVVVVDDGSSDGTPQRLATLARDDSRLTVVAAQGLGPARSRNRGAREARGAYLAFLDAHCYAPSGWLEPILATLEAHPETGVAGPAIGDTNNVGLRGLGGTWHDLSLDMHWIPDGGPGGEVPFQPAGCQVVRREVFQQVGGYDEGLSRWGSEDVEFCLRVWLSGWAIRVEPRSTVYHYFRTAPPYAVDLPQIVYNKLRMCFLHFDGPLLARVLAPQLAHPHAAQALARIFTDGTVDAARVQRERRRRDMAWFCSRFGLLA